MIIDSHQHFWKYSPATHGWISEEMAVLKRDFLPEDYLPIAAEHQIMGTVAVQADQSHNETVFLLEQASKFDFIKGVVGWVDLRADDLEDRLASLQDKRLKGFRHILQSEPESFMLDQHFIKGVNTVGRNGYTYDLLIYHHQLQEALQFVAKVPDVKIVVDHIAKPSIRTSEKTAWELNLAALSTFENVYCKLSGMVTEANWSDWTFEKLEPYVEEVFEAFGSNRIMYGSDWPVCLLAGEYKDQLGVVEQYTSKLTDHEKALVLGENAKRFYNL